MSASFRPVIEQRGAHSGCFVEPTDLDTILTALSFASNPEGKVSSNDYDEVNVVWIEDGRKFLDYIDSNDVDQLMSDKGEIEDLDDADQVRTVLSNIKNMSTEWQQHIHKDGSLRFYIDQY